MTAKKGRPASRQNGPSSTLRIPPYQQAHGEVSVPMSAWATAYAELGWPIHPLRPGTKRPLTQHGVLDATTDLAQIQDWWSRWPHANIGAACGAAFDVGDFDTRVHVTFGVERTSRLALERLNAHCLLAGAAGMSTTRHGGLHLFFPPSGEGVHHLGSRAVDFIGAGGYVVLPPSVVPPDADICGRGVYSWLQFPYLDAPGSAPADWTRWKQVLDPGPHSRGDRRGTPSPWFGTRGLEVAVRRAGVGSRNNATFWAVNRALETGRPIDAIRSAARDTGLDPAEIEAIVRSAQSRAGRP